MSQTSQTKRRPRCVAHTNRGAKTTPAPQVVYYTVNAGQVIRVRMAQTITSENARVGDQFTTTTVVPVYASGIEVIPAGSEIIGRVASVTLASRKSKAGTIGVHFVSLRLPTGIARAMNGDLTDVAVNNITADNEGEVSGRSAMKRNVVFIVVRALVLDGAMPVAAKVLPLAHCRRGLGAAGAVFSKDLSGCQSGTDLS